MKDRKANEWSGGLWESQKQDREKDRQKDRKKREREQYMNQFAFFLLLVFRSLSESFCNMLYPCVLYD